MSKKKKKTRQEKAQTTHNFGYLKKSSASQSKQTEVNGEAVESRKENKTSNIDPLYFLDLKRVAMFIGISIVIIGVLGFLVYKTNTFNFIFNKFGIKY